MHLKKDIQMQRLAFRNFAALDPSGVFLLVPQGLILFVFVPAIKMHNY